jgi:hypothetical protein
MLLALGAVSSALDALQSLTTPKPKSPPATGFSQNSTNPFDLSGSTPASGTPTPTTGGSGFAQISPGTMSTLLAAQGQASTTPTTSATSTSPSDALKGLFSQLDANGDGQISKSEFENALGAGGTNLAQADDVFGKMDKNGDGSVSLDEMSSALKGGKGRHHHHASGSDSASGSAGSSSDPLLQALDGASTTSTSNSDGLTTTSVTYADGSKVTMTSAAAKTASTNATSSYNLIEQMIQREAQSLSSGVNSSLSMNV